MIESWTMSERTYEPQKSFYSYGGSFDQISSMGMDGNNSMYGGNGNQQAGREAYMEYSWLFNGRRK